MTDIKADLAETIAFALGQRGRVLGVKLDERTRKFLADEVAEHIYRSNFIVTQGPPTPPHSTHATVEQLERQAENAMVEAILVRMERDFWLYDKEAEETICPLSNYADWTKLVEIVRKRLK